MNVNVGDVWKDDGLVDGERPLNSEWWCRGYYYNFPEVPSTGEGTTILPVISYDWNKHFILDRGPNRTGQRCFSG